jgi:CRISPR-associated exonuclease Cas4
MQLYEKKYVSVSSITSYYICPRLAYFRNGRSDGPGLAEVRAGVFKSVSHSLSSVISSPDHETALVDAIDSAGQDTLCIYGAAFEDVVQKTVGELKARKADILSGLQHERVRRGEKAVSSTLTPLAIGLTIYSDKLRISGTLDKVADIGSGPAPVIISASLPPQSGVYSSDRIRLAAYTMLLSEKYGVECAHGCIEYVPCWCLREAEVRYEDKRKVLYARNRMLEIMEGRMPDASRGKWCERCAFSGTCSVRVSLLDSLFKK